ncbi:MAG: cytidine deaminase [Microscillaceae bacterium]|jgi:cytidine deaminase|nr:cytidine deaminase [Microscillaceae bacterium]
MNKNKKFDFLEISVAIEIYSDASKLDTTTAGVLQAARLACDKAYAPYSNYHVGAAILLQSGKIILGVNQENAAYPSGLCAERVALFNYGVQFPHSEDEILMMAVAARPANSSVFVATSPCGACRQVMVEFADKQAQNIQFIFQAEGEKIYKLANITDLMPLRFSRKNLLEL